MGTLARHIQARRHTCSSLISVCDIQTLLSRPLASPILHYTSPPDKLEAQQAYTYSLTMSLCVNRLSEERKSWRRDHPFGFFAKPMRGANGMMDLKKWDCGVPGKEKTLWEGGLFKLELSFPDEYP